jgi:hypothetical protein
MIEQQERMPDLVVNRCPVRCSDCKAIYLNKQTLHRIICRCPCHTLTEDKREQKDKLQSASLVASPERRAAVTSTTTLGEDTIGRLQKEANKV